MVGLTCGTGPAFEHRDTLDYVEGQCDVSVLRELPVVKNARFRVREIVVIWYHRDKKWYKGRIVSGGSGCYQVEFRYARGPRIRNWYKVSRGLIKRNTLRTRNVLKAHEIVLGAKS